MNPRTNHERLTPNQAHQFPVSQPPHGLGSIRTRILTVSELTRRSDDLPSSVHLVLCLPKPEISFHWVSQLAPFVASASPVDDDNHIIKRARKIVMPVAFKPQVDHLTIRSPIPARKKGAHRPISSSHEVTNGGSRCPAACDPRGRPHHVDAGRPEPAGGLNSGSSAPPPRNELETTHTRKRTGYFVRPESSIRGGRISLKFSSIGLSSVRVTSLAALRTAALDALPQIRSRHSLSTNRTGPPDPQVKGQYVP